MPDGEFFLEVRCEEVPARMLQPGIHELGTRLFEELMGRGLTPAEVQTGFTPRRLVVTLTGLPEREPDRIERRTGPPAKVAWGEDGQPTKALLGFAERCGIEADQIEVETTEKGEYLVATVDIPGVATNEVLSEIVPRVLASLNWPKSMHWGASEGPWVRPVHSIVALLDGEIVEFELFGVQSGDRTIGHPIHSPEEIVVTDSARYHSELAARGIVVDFEERKAALLAGLEAAAAGVGGTLVPDAALLDRLTSICGVPGVVQGDIEAMDLPREVLATSLRDHQSAFTAESGGELLPCFLTVMDRSEDPEGRVRRGNEWVVAARLDDARFFYGEDRKAALADRVELLGQVTFHERLGSYSEKTARIVTLSDLLCEAVGYAGDRQSVLEAARLLKTDLTCEMVKEFTSLQGIVGGVYGREEGLPEDVWQAVYDQYLPASSRDPVPRGQVGRIVSLADRIDTLVGMFGCGLIPTGSKDPFGLRRVAQGAVRIVLEADFRFDMAALVGRSVELYGERLEGDGESVLESLRPFLFDRMRYLLGLDGFAYDEIEAGLASSGHELPDLRDRIVALHQVRSEAGFLDVVLAAKRIANILRDAERDLPLSEELFEEEAERELFAESQELEEHLTRAEAEGDYVAALGRIAEFAGVLDRFFVEVLVMADEPRVRTNRLALLQSIHRTLSRTASLTEMVVDRSDHKSKN